jgi:hypothetical protein
MNLIGPKSIASKLHLVVKILFFMQIARVVLMAIAPILPSSIHQYLSFDVQSGPLELGFDVFRGSRSADGGFGAWSWFHEPAIWWFSICSCESWNLPGSENRFISKRRAACG